MQEGYGGLLRDKDATLTPDLSGALTAFNRIGCNSLSSPTIGHSDCCHQNFRS
jgi:hypothetical protein